MVRVIRCRIEDIVVGDVINRDPDELAGWFEVEDISVMFDGKTQLADGAGQRTVTGTEKDIVGVQLLEEVELDDETGLVAPEAERVMAMPVEAVPPPTAQEPATPIDGVAESAEEEAEPDDQPEELGPPAPEELEPGGLDFKSGPDIDLNEVLEALTSLDVGEEDEPTADDEPTNGDAPQPVPASLQKPRRSTDPEGTSFTRRSPDAPPPAAMPEGAVPVYGDTLPDAPSYRNPVVVRDPEAAPLPSRRG